MSGGERRKRASRGQGWEEAGAEFYQESYPSDVDMEALQRDPSRIATLLPSKQVQHTLATAAGRHRGDTKHTIRRRPSTRSQCHSTARRGSVANDVHVAMLPDLTENLSNEERTWEEIMLIKSVPVNMAQKRELKAKLQRATKLRLQGFEQFKWQRRKMWQQMKSRWKEIFSNLELWQHSLKKIEGNFGTGIVAFFLFVKWLMFLNLTVFLLVFLFIVLPTILLDTTGSGTCMDPKKTHGDCCSNRTVVECCSAKYVNQSSDENIVLDVIQGTGWMEKTLLFYGFYSSEVLTIDAQRHLFYDLPLAFIATTVVYFILSLVAIVKSAAEGFKERLLEGEGQLYQYCNLVFGGWDFCINNEKAANIKHKALFNEIKGCIEAERLKEERQNRSKEEKMKLVCIRIIINIIVLIILIGAGSVIYFTFQFHLTQRKDREDPTNLSEQLLGLVLEYLPSLTIVGLNLFIPLLFTSLVTMEKYSPAFVVRINLFRTIFLRLASLGVLMVSLYLTVSCDVEDDQCDNEDCGIPLCWETYVGQQIYKLVILDFVASALITFFVNLPRMLIAKHFESKFAKLIGEQEFQLSTHVLDVVYSQALCWLGSFYSPFLPALASIKCFFVFYIKKFACLVNSTPSSTVYRASRSSSLFMVILLVSYVVTVLPVGYSIAELQPSKSCGPFRGRDTVWTLIVFTFEKLPDWIQSTLFFFGTAGFAVPAFIVLLLALYYFYAVSEANKHMVAVLKNQLMLEGHDKQFLLNRLSAFIKQQQEHQKANHPHELTNITDISNES